MSRSLAFIASPADRPACDRFSARLNPSFISAAARASSSARNIAAPTRSVRCATARRVRAPPPSSARSTARTRSGEASRPSLARSSAARARLRPLRRALRVERRPLGRAARRACASKTPRSWRFYAAAPRSPPPSPSRRASPPRARGACRTRRGETGAEFSAIRTPAVSRARFSSRRPTRGRGAPTPSPPPCVARARRRPPPRGARPRERRRWAPTQGVPTTRGVPTRGVPMPSPVAGGRRRPPPRGRGGRTTEGPGTGRGRRRVLPPEDSREAGVRPRAKASVESGVRRRRNRRRVPSQE